MGNTHFPMSGFNSIIYTRKIRLATERYAAYILKDFKNAYNRIFDFLNL